MSLNTYGKIKGFVSHEEILEFIRNNYDSNANDHVSFHDEGPLSDITWEHQINEHSADNENKYSWYGYISFKHNNDRRSLFYSYCNVNSLENLAFYKEHNLENMVRAETTFISLSYWKDSVEIIKAILEHFGGGWIDENDCDNQEYYPYPVPEGYKPEGTEKLVEYEACYALNNAFVFRFYADSDASAREIARNLTESPELQESFMASINREAVPGKKSRSYFSLRSVSKTNNN